MILFVSVLILLILSVWAFFQLPQFGKAPEGKRLQRISQSPNYKNGTFQNLNPTPALTEGASYTTIFKEFFFGKNKNVVPPATIPSQKQDLHQLNPNEDLLIWFGHSSYFMQLSGKRFLIDPVFSGNASPFTFTTKSFMGADIYKPEDMPEIDYLIITHDHYDHLDYKTVKALLPKVKQVITGLGVGAHLQHWGYNINNITELDWCETVNLDNGFSIKSMPARHFSGRLFKRNTTLWMAVILTTPTKKIYIGGDSGYDNHFSAIGNEYGPFDLAILENGQYNKNWKYIHSMPEETVLAAIDLKAKILLPVHWGKFNLSLHNWDEPIKAVVQFAKLKNMSILHPLIGETVYLDIEQKFEQWWLDVK